MPVNIERKAEELDQDCCSEVENARGNPVAEKIAKMNVEAAHRQVMERIVKDANENAAEEKK